MDKLALLIVESNTNLRRSLKAILQERMHGLVINTSESILGAMSDIADNRPDIILTHITVAGGSGLAFAKTIIDAYSCIQMIVVSDYAIPEYRKAARSFNTRKLTLINDYGIDTIVTLLEPMEKKKIESGIKRSCSPVIIKAGSSNATGIAPKNGFVLA